MSKTLSNSITFDDIEFHHTHPRNESDKSEHIHKANVTLTFNAASGEKVALPITTSVLKEVRDKLQAIAKEPLHGNFEESAEKILDGIRAWLPELKKMKALQSTHFNLTEVSIEVTEDVEGELHDVIHPDLQAAQVSRLVYTARI